MHLSEILLMQLRKQWRMSLADMLLVACVFRPIDLAVARLARAVGSGRISFDFAHRVGRAAKSKVFGRGA